MSSIDGLDKLAFVGFLLSTMLSLGLHTDAGDLRALLQARLALVRTLAANFVVAPLLGLLIVRLVPLPPGSGEALLILACVPGGLSAVQFTRKVKGEEALAGALVVLLSALAVLVSPLLLRWVLPGEWNADLPYLRVVGLYTALLLAPLAAGMLLGDRSPRLAGKLSPVLGIVSAVLFITFMLTTKSFRKEAVASIGWAAAGAMLLFIVGCMVAGWLLGGPHRGRRQMLASTTSVRNAALAMAVARDTPGAGAVLMPALVAFSLLMVPPNTLFTLWHQFRARRAAAPEA